MSDRPVRNVTTNVQLNGYDLGGEREREREVYFPSDGVRPIRWTNKSSPVQKHK